CAPKRRSTIWRRPHTKWATQSYVVLSKPSGMCSMPRWPSSIASAFPPLHLTADGQAAVKVVSRFGTLYLERQVFAPAAPPQHALSGNPLLPAHHGEIITRGLQELGCLLPQDLSFASVERLLGWQTQQAQVLSESTVRNLVRSHGLLIRQAEQ